MLLEREEAYWVPGYYPLVLLFFTIMLMDCSASKGVSHTWQHSPRLLVQLSEPCMWVGYGAMIQASLMFLAVQENIIR